MFLARRGHITGAIDIHEMAWDSDGDLWFVNTLFSCLCTLDRIELRAALAAAVRQPLRTGGSLPSERPGMRDGKPRYVTALGETNTPQGWRENKGNGGLLMDVATTIASSCAGLSMPHSPRWYDNRLWVLESGRGALVTIDPKTGEKTDVASVPGFCRGLDFIGPVAFIGLSQLRETNAFTDIEITEDNADRQSWRVGRAHRYRQYGRPSEIHRRRAGNLRGAGAPGVLFPEIIHEGEHLATSYALPDEALREVKFSAPVATAESVAAIADHGVTRGSDRGASV